MSQGNLTLIAVPFHGDTITCIETPEGVFVPLKPCCEQMKLDFSAQYRRMNRDLDLWGIAVMATPSALGGQEMACIPVNRIAAWLFSMDASRVKPEVQQKLRLYQREAADVLDRHFRLREEEKTEEIRQLRGQLDHCHSHLRAALPKWGQLLAMIETGNFNLAVMAARVGWTQDRSNAELHAIQRCGMLLPEGVADNTAASWLARIADLERRLQSAQDLRQAEARDMTLAGYRKLPQNAATSDVDLDQPSLFGIH